MHNLQAMHILNSYRVVLLHKKFRENLDCRIKKKMFENKNQPHFKWRPMHTLQEIGILFN